MSSREVSQPAVFPVMDDFRGYFHDLIEVQEAVDDEDGHLKDKCEQGTDGQYEAPEVNEVAHEPEPHVAARVETAVDKDRIRGFSREVETIENHSKERRKNPNF